MPCHSSAMNRSTSSWPSCRALPRVVERWSSPPTSRPSSLRPCRRGVMERGARGRGTLVAAVWALALLWPGSGSVHAAPPPFAYLVTKVTAVGGNPIKEVEKGVIFQRVGGCEIGAPLPPPAKPLAGSLGGTVNLALEIQSCPAGGPAPTGQCRLQVGDGAPATFPVSGWQAT